MKKAIKGVLEDDKTVYFIQAIDNNAMKQFKGELTDNWDFETLKKLFIKEFLDETTLLAEKEEFMLFGLIKGESLMNFHLPIL